MLDDYIASKRAEFRDSPEDLAEFEGLLVEANEIAYEIMSRIAEAADGKPRYYENHLFTVLMEVLEARRP